MQSLDILDRLLEHDAWTTRQVLALAGRLSDEQLDQDFDIGHRTVRETFQHIIENIETWSRGYPPIPSRDSSGNRSSPSPVLYGPGRVAPT
jgi:uncharacterized damage-inducible protein DinB